MQVRDRVVGYTGPGDEMRMRRMFQNIPCPRWASTPRPRTSCCMTRLHSMETRCWTSPRKWLRIFLYQSIRTDNGMDSFVHTWMPEDADKLIMENMNKNIVDLDEYPAASLIHNRCISMCKFGHSHQSPEYTLICDDQWPIFGRHLRRAKLLGQLLLDPQRRSCSVALQWRSDGKKHGRQQAKIISTPTSFLARMLKWPSKNLRGE